MKDRNTLPSPLSSLLSTYCRGQSLVEVLVAVAVGTIIVLGAIGIVAIAVKSAADADRARIGAALGNELLRNVRVFAESGWHKLYNLTKGSSAHYYLQTASSPFVAVAGDETVTVGGLAYTRYFYVENVSRDAGGAITGSGGTDDPSTQRIVVVYSVPRGPTVSLDSYLTRFRDEVIWQSDWSGGGGYENPVTSTGNRFSTSSNINVVSSTGAIIINGF